MDKSTTSFKVKDKDVIIDTEDWERVSKIKWSLKLATNKKAYYIQGWIKNNEEWQRVSLHRFLLGFPENKQIDHKNGNKLDNRKENLRICDYFENNRNRYDYIDKKGTVGITKQNNKYIVRI